MNICTQQNLRTNFVTVSTINSSNLSFLRFLLRRAEFWLTNVFLDHNLDISGGRCIETDTFRGWSASCIDIRLRGAPSLLCDTEERALSAGVETEVTITRKGTLPLIKQKHGITAVFRTEIGHDGIESEM